MPPRKLLSPWIEALILGFEPGEERGGGCRLKAHVVGVGPMSQSQTQGSEDPQGLLFLSDGVLQIPAVLTSAAWERLQEQEDRESLSSLLHSTVCVRDHRLRFHTSAQQNRCRFYLSVGEVATTAAGPVRDCPPCSTTLPSVQLKICRTWRSQQQQQQETQESPDGLDLSELLDEWRHDCVQTLLGDVRDRLMSVRPPSSQPSTSTCNPPPSHPDASTTTSWDLDRIRFKGDEGFRVPIKCLLIPEEDGSPQEAGAGTCFSAAPPEDLVLHPHTTTSSEDRQEGGETSPLPVGHLIDSVCQLRTNPWDVFPPPGDASTSSDVSPTTSPTNTLHQDSTESQPDPVAMVTSTQLPASSSRTAESRLSSDHSFIAPYQRAPLRSTTPSCPPEASDPVAPPTVDSESSGTDAEGTDEGERRMSKRKRRDVSPAEEAPSWLFDSRSGSGVEEVKGHEEAQTMTSDLRPGPIAHGDGTPFTYSYQPSVQNLQDLGQLDVPESMLHWAVRYLVPQQTDKLVTCERSKVTTL